MRRIHRHDALASLFALALLLTLSAFFCYRGDGSGPTTVILVRHAEKAAVPGDDPPLDAVGERRARSLAEALRATKVDAVLVTQYRRTALTAAPLAAAARITPRVVDTRMGGTVHASAVAEAVRGESGKTVLVVGHSNTIPAIVRALGGTAADMSDADYDDLYILIMSPAGTRTIHARYGAPASSPAAGGGS
jgi:broad specificity phosphatase PhoE